MIQKREINKKMLRLIWLHYIYKKRSYKKAISEKSFFLKIWDYLQEEIIVRRETLYIRETERTEKNNFRFSYGSSAKAIKFLSRPFFYERDFFEQTIFKRNFLLVDRFALIGQKSVFHFGLG